MRLSVVGRSVVGRSEGLPTYRRLTASDCPAPLCSSLSRSPTVAAFAKLCFAQIDLITVFEGAEQFHAFQGTETQDRFPDSRPASQVSAARPVIRDSSSASGRRAYIRPLLLPPVRQTRLPPHRESHCAAASAWRCAENPPPARQTTSASADIRPKFRSARCTIALHDSPAASGTVDPAKSAPRKARHSLRAPAQPPRNPALPFAARSAASRSSG